MHLKQFRARPKKKGVIEIKIRSEDAFSKLS